VARPGQSESRLQVPAKLQLEDRQLPRPTHCDSCTRNPERTDTDSELSCTTAWTVQQQGTRAGTQSATGSGRRALRRHGAVSDLNRDVLTAEGTSAKSASGSLRHGWTATTSSGSLSCHTASGVATTRSLRVTRSVVPVNMQLPVPA
jgi:hypothetical protein